MCLTMAPFPTLRPLWPVENNTHPVYHCLKHCASGLGPHWARWRFGPWAQQHTHCPHCIFRFADPNDDTGPAPKTICGPSSNTSLEPRAYTQPHTASTCQSTQEMRRYTQICWPWTEASTSLCDHCTVEFHKLHCKRARTRKSYCLVSLAAFPLFPLFSHPCSLLLLRGRLHFVWKRW